jgi:peptidoglycan/xylan/chitin deacetylase (PgdA/CDA1 family)
MIPSRNSSASPQVAVLLYHHVGDANPACQNLALSVSASKFKRQVRWLRWRGYKSITPRQWLHHRSTGEPLPEKLVMFTFDDAYADLAVNALPILERFGFNGAVYAITKKLGNSLAWDGMPVMTREQLLHWASRGFEIGAHTQTHPDLMSLPDPAIIEEVRGSKSDLVEAGLELSSFAYPYGNYDGRVRDLLEGIFPIALTCEEGINDADTDLLQIKRTMVHPGDTLLDIEFKVAFGRSPLDKWRERIRFRSRIRDFLRRAGLFSRKNGSSPSGRSMR